VGESNKQRPPRRIPNAQRRPREYLTEAEVDQLCKAARKRGRYGQRDATMILVAFRHGLRVGELVALRWDQLDFDSGLMHVNRLKNGVSSVHPISGRELRGLRQIKREQPVGSRFVFMTERGAPFTPNGFGKMLSRIGEAAGLPFPVHPHMLRHACGFKLANAGHDTRALQHYLGHRQIQHTVRYTEMAPGRFNGFWKD
jgi:type 1 fimbriae regulatory protein FimB/type 1 fimbriae regulatory protein FimE